MTPLSLLLCKPMAYAAAVLLASSQLDSSSIYANALFVAQHRGTKIQCRAVPRTSLPTSTRLALSSTAFEIAPGIDAAVNGEGYSNGFASPPPLQRSAYHYNDIDALFLDPADLPASTGDDWHAEAPNDQEQLVAVSKFRNNRDGNRRTPIRNVVTGREKRAGWESYAPARATSGRLHAGFGGVVGSPGGVGDWRFTSSYGPATITAASSSVSTRNGGYGATATPTINNKRANNVPNDAGQQLAKQHHVITGRERRASFDSFSPFAPSHENRSRQGISGSPSQEASSSNAEEVAATLSALPAPNHDDRESSSLTTPSPEERACHHGEQQVNGGDGIIEDTETVVPMDTPARQSLPSHLSLRPIPGKGIGVITNKPISMGDLIGNYEGEMMSEEVKDRRYLTSLQDTLTSEDREWIQSRLDRGQTLTGCYLYGVSLDDENIYGRFGSTEVDEENSAPPRRIYIDAEDEYESLWTRFINHASPPYNNAQPKSVPESYDGKPRVWFMANRDIEAGEEICFDYGDDYWLEGDDVY